MIWTAGSNPGPSGQICGSARRRKKTLGGDVSGMNVFGSAVPDWLPEPEAHPSCRLRVTDDAG